MGDVGTVGQLQSVLHPAMLTDTQAAMGLARGTDPTLPSGDTPNLQQ